MRLRLGTRGSALARAQAAEVTRRLERLGHHVETEVITTAGDRRTDCGFADVGAFGVFVREIETALLDGRVDLAVHSYKDLPSRGPGELMVAAVPERLDAADVLLIRPDAQAPGLGELPLREAASVGTSAARRQALLREMRPDLAVGLLRGNVPTRLSALAEGRFDAIVLAAAGLARLERAAAGGSQAIVPEGVIRTRLDPSTFVPAPAQGAIAVQVRADAGPVCEAVAALDDPSTARMLSAERELLRLAEAGCDLPFGAWCRTADGGQLVLVAVLGAAGAPLVRVQEAGDEPVALARAVWRRLANGSRS